MTNKSKNTKIQAYGKNLYLPWSKHNKGIDEKDYMGLVTDGTHVSNPKSKLGLRELTIGKDSNINP